MPQLVGIEDDRPLAIPWLRARGHEPIERYRLRDIVNWCFAPRELARAADARETDRRRDERRTREELLAKAPPGAPVLAYAVPKYVLDGAGLPVRQPRWHAPDEAPPPPEAPTPATTP